MIGIKRGKAAEKVVRDEKHSAEVEGNCLKTRPTLTLPSERN
jgi:hypothetical protein